MRSGTPLKEDYTVWPSVSNGINS